MIRERMTEFDFLLSQTEVGLQNNFVKYAQISELNIMNT